MATTTYGVGTVGGGVIGDGIRTLDEAIAWAQEQANERGETLYVWRSGQAGGPDDIAVEPEAPVTVDSVDWSDLVEDEGAVDADVTVRFGDGAGGEYGVTLKPSADSGDLAEWGTIDHWISAKQGASPVRSIPEDVRAEIVAKVRGAAAGLE